MIEDLFAVALAIGFALAVLAAMIVVFVYVRETTR